MPLPSIRSTAPFGSFSRFGSTSASQFTVSTLSENTTARSPSFTPIFSSSATSAVSFAESSSPMPSARSLRVVSASISRASFALRSRFATVVRNARCDDRNDFSSVYGNSRLRESTTGPPVRSSPASHTCVSSSNTRSSAGVAAQRTETDGPRSGHRSPISSCTSG